MESFANFRTCLVGREPLDTLQEKICDTLELSNLFFPGKTTHKMMLADQYRIH